MKTKGNSNKRIQSQNIKTNNIKKKKKTSKNVQLKRKIILISVLIFILFGALLLILFSDLFNTKNIIVQNNLLVPTQNILENSALKVGNNMFKTLNSTIKKSIKANPYIDKVKVSKKLNGDVIIYVEERTPSFNIQSENGYIYINNQGYLLEEAQTPLELPIIKGCNTQELALGQRLDKLDLKKLDIVIQIMDAAESNGIREKITSVDIENNNNFILEIPSEGKTVQFGDSSNIDIKILWVVSLIEKTKGVEGEIVLNVPDIKKVYFREKV